MSRCDWGASPEDCMCAECRAIVEWREAGYPCNTCGRKQPENPRGVCDECWRALACKSCGKKIGEPTEGCPREERHTMRGDGEMVGTLEICCHCHEERVAEAERVAAAARQQKRQDMLARRQPCPSCGKPRILPWAGAVCAACFKKGTAT